MQGSGCGGCKSNVRQRCGPGGYDIQPIHFVYGKNKVTYTAKDIDVLAAYIIPLDVLYVVPIEAIGAGTSLRLYPEGGCKVARFEGYREGWGLFGGKVRRLGSERRRSRFLFGCRF